VFALVVSRHTPSHLAMDFGLISQLAVLGGTPLLLAACNLMLACIIAGLLFGRPRVMLGTSPPGPGPAPAPLMPVAMLQQPMPDTDDDSSDSDPGGDNGHGRDWICCHISVPIHV
jgi:hypothetical protein